jgi:hypothetical protein
MKARNIAFAMVLASLALFSSAAQETEPSKVTPAWVIEKQIAAPAPAPAPPPAASQRSSSIFFIGYDYPTMSGSLADNLDTLNSPLNFSLGFESFDRGRSSPLAGIELELMVAANDNGTRFIMNDMVMIGYSFALDPIRLNLGGRIGLAMLDVLDDTGSGKTCTGLGVVGGPEASIYLNLGKDFWIWLRSRYSLAYFLGIDGSYIASGNDSINTLSAEAGFGFKM